MANFTQGKWEIEYDSGRDATFIYSLDSSDGIPIWIAVISNSGTPEEKNANARLIAAAPEMYGLLKTICSGRLSGASSNVWAACREARKLLARIDGHEQENYTNEGDKLISLLQKFNPDADVLLHNPNGDKVLLVLSGADTPNSIWLAGEDDFDVLNEIDSRCEAASLENWDEPDFYSEFLEDGFDYALMKKYKGKDWADNFLANAKHFGLIDDEQEDIS